MRTFSRFALMLILGTLFACSGVGKGKLAERSTSRDTSQAQTNASQQARARTDASYSGQQLGYEACIDQCLNLDTGHLMPEQECQPCAGLLGELDGINPRVDQLRGLYSDDIQNTFFGRSPLHTDFAPIGPPNPWQDAGFFRGSDPRATVPFAYRNPQFRNDGSLYHRGFCRGTQDRWRWGRAPQEHCQEAQNNPDSVAVWSYFISKVDDAASGAGRDGQLVRTTVTELERDRDVFCDHAPGAVCDQYDDFRLQLDLFGGLKGMGRGIIQGQKRQAQLVLNRLGQGLMRSLTFLRHRPLTGPCFEAQNYGYHPGYANACLP